MIKVRQPPGLPRRLQRSTFGRPGLNRRVRDGNGCDPGTHRHRKYVKSMVSAAGEISPTRELAHGGVDISPDISGLARDRGNAKRFRGALTTSTSE